MHLEEPQLTPACPRNSSDLTPPRVALVTTPPRRPCTHVVLDLEGVLLSLAVGGSVIGMVLGQLWARAAEGGLGIRSLDNALPDHHVGCSLLCRFQPVVSWWLQQWRSRTRTLHHPS
jgi:hypothetical protein